ncbi:uncharacterized protein B0T23DRAFT_408532 [Neurospora hispaniola]|uniref:Rhodopsin domain-containing protein n=1 Tax=Neurospora hispaniola TaxID=588809 RepID=A0AAJ0HYV1_9PEZI|nr:hypothetical protein B0T23DRAFT_408532 [Neurospora hispaniola]
MEHKKGKTIVPVMWGTMILFPVLALVFIILRLYCRRWLKNATAGYLDDYVLILSWILMVITSIIGLMLAKHGVGTAIVEGQEIIVEPEVMHALLFWTSNLLLFGINAIAFSKVSWFITLIRLVTKRWQKVVLWVLMVFSTAALFVASTFGYYQCHFLPDGSWNTPATSDQRCLDNWVAIKISLATSIYSTVLEFALAAVPAYVMGIICATSVGFVSAMMGALRTKAYYDHLFPLGNIPFLRPLVKKMAKAHDEEELSWP